MQCISIDYLYTSGTLPPIFSYSWKNSFNISENPLAIKGINSIVIFMEELFTGPIMNIYSENLSLENYLKLENCLTIFTKSSILDALLGSE